MCKFKSRFLIAFITFGIAVSGVSFLNTTFKVNKTSTENFQELNTFPSQEPKDTNQDISVSDYASQGLQIPVTESGFTAIKLALQGKTKIPVVIPTSFPEGDVSYEFYGNISIPDNNSYEVVIGFDPYCSGGNSCRIGSLYGKFNKSKRLTGLPNSRYERNKIERVKLLNGIVGYFEGSTLGAGFTDACIYWKQGNYEYMVGLKGGEKKEMIKFANSAIKSSLTNAPFRETFNRVIFVP